MSGNGYNYYYSQNSQNYGGNNRNWNQWSTDEQYRSTEEQYRSTDEQYRSTDEQYRSIDEQYRSTDEPYNHNQQNNSQYNSHNLRGNQNYYNGANNRHYNSRRYNPKYNSTGSQNWQPPQRQQGVFKRPRDDSLDLSDNKIKTTRKKKKPLSQNIPSKKDWTFQEAEQALAIEKEYNKRYKNHSLIIKFPDLELNRDMVSNFHPAIENVHFQQPSTPRFCFVTLQETSNADDVIKYLNTIKFGDGLLTAEYKRDREEDQNIGPEDIDPLTLYVGNLAQEITKEDMVKTYPRGRRIDIGFAKKMKYTRYAFVSFKSVTDSIQAFKNTHNTQMYSKSLIVRFRRLHGTVGMPGESKLQSPIKKTVAKENPPASARVEETNKEARPDLGVVKQETPSSDEEDYETSFVSVKKEDDEDDEDEDELPPFMSAIDTYLPNTTSTSTEAQVSTLTLHESGPKIPKPIKVKIEQEEEQEQQANEEEFSSKVHIKQELDDEQNEFFEMDDVNNLLDAHEMHVERLSLLKQSHSKN